MWAIQRMKTLGLIIAYAFSPPASLLSHHCCYNESQENVNAEKGPGIPGFKNLALSLCL